MRCLTKIHGFGLLLTYVFCLETVQVLIGHQHISLDPGIFESPLNSPHTSKISGFSKALVIDNEIDDLFMNFLMILDYLNNFENETGDQLIVAQV